MTDLIPNDLGHFEGNEIPEDFESDSQVDNCIEMSDYSNNGLCPCCGNEVETKGGNYDDSELSDYCEYCGWKGSPYYG